MRRLLIISLTTISLNAYTIGTLFDALKHNPTTTLDNLTIKNTQLAEDLVISKLMPQIDLKASYEHFNSPTNLLPVTPKTSATFKNPNIPQPFGDDILRVGVTFEMPLFVKSIYTTKEQLKYINLSTKAKKKLNYIQKEAIIVGSNASWKYLLNLKKALLAKKSSIKKSKQSIQVGVKAGKYPKSMLYKIDEALNQIDININKIDLKIEEAKNAIFELTNIILSKPVNITQVKNISMKNFLALSPLLAKQNAQKLKIKATKEKLYPSFMIKGKYFYNQTDAYNNNKEVDKDYSSIGVYMNLPIFNDSTLVEIEKSKVEYQKSKMLTAKTLLSLKAKANNLKTSIPILQKSINLAKKSVQNQKKLLKIAKVAYKTKAMTEEEYLRYEDALSNAKANLYLLEAKKIEAVSNLAILYGNNLQRIYK